MKWPSINLPRESGVSFLWWGFCKYFFCIFSSKIASRSSGNIVRYFCATFFLVLAMVPANGIIGEGLNKPINLGYRCTHHELCVSFA